MFFVSVLVLIASAVVLGAVRKMLEDAPVWIEGVLVFVFCAIWGLIPFALLGCIVDGDGNLIYYMYRLFGVAIKTFDIIAWMLTYVPMLVTGIIGVLRAINDESESGSIMTSLKLFFFSLAISVQAFVVVFIIGLVIGLIVMIVSMPEIIGVILFLIILIGSGIGSYKCYEVTIKKKN